MHALHMKNIFSELLRVRIGRGSGRNLVGSSFSFCSERQKSALLKGLATNSKVSIHIYICNGRQVLKTQIQSERCGRFTIGR